MTDILLVKQDWSKFGVSVPLGLLYISAYLKGKGYEVLVRDLNYHTMDDLWKPIQRGEIPIVGVSMLSSSRRSSYELIGRVKALNPNVRIALGGNHTSSLYEILCDNLPIDAVVVGEGEITMYELTERWLNGGKVDDVWGAYVKGGRYVPRPLIEDLDSLPFPDYEQIDFSQYVPHIVRTRPDYVHNGIRLRDTAYTNVITSRGCIGRCLFCDIYKHWGSKPRFRSARNVVDEIVMLNQDYGVNFIEFNDDSFALNQKIAKEICQKIIDEGLKIVWVTAIRADCCRDSELLELMRDSGCLWLAVGVESGSDKILKNIGKGTTRELNREAIENIKKAGIKAYALLMCGNIGENDETINETKEFLLATNPDIHSEAGATYCYPGTRYSELMRIDTDFWIDGEDGLPIFHEGFTKEDLTRWGSILASIPSWAHPPQSCC